MKINVNNIKDILPFYSFSSPFQKFKQYTLTLKNLEKLRVDSSLESLINSWNVEISRAVYDQGWLKPKIVEGKERRYKIFFFSLNIDSSSININMDIFLGEEKICYNKVKIYIDKEEFLN